VPDLVSLFVSDGLVALGAGSVDDVLSDGFASFAGPSADEDVSVVAALAADRELVLRSFFAQPLPLKWIDGAEKAFRTGLAWQIGQASGPGAVTPWITSNRWPFGQR
jgi:hypothetical protein